MQHGFTEPSIIYTLKPIFNKHIIGLDANKFTGNGTEWPLYSLDQNMHDYFALSYIKERILKGALVY